jgi:hypothetical protein
MAEVVQFTPKGPSPEAAFAKEVMESITAVISKIENPSRHGVGELFQIVSVELARAGAMLKAWPDGPMGDQG